MRTGIYVIITASISLSSCGTAKEPVASAKERSPKAVCTTLPLQAEEPAMAWTKADRPAERSTGNFRLPKQFDSYSISRESLNRYFSYAGKQNRKTSFAVPLPGKLGCQYFNVAHAGTMSAELAEKYPQLASLKGAAVNDPTAEIRLDYDGEGKMSAQITWNGDVYYVTPVEDTGGIVYIVYDRNDTNEVKQPFEEKQVQPGINFKRQGAQPLYDR